MDQRHADMNTMIEHVCVIANVTLYIYEIKGLAYEL